MRKAKAEKKNEENVYSNPNPDIKWNFPTLLNEISEKKLWNFSFYKHT